MAHFNKEQLLIAFYLMCFKCAVIGTNYFLPNSDIDMKKTKDKMIWPIIVYRTIGHVAGVVSPT